MEDFAVVRQYLGGSKIVGSPQSELDFVPLIRKGLPFSAFASLRARANLSEETICQSLGIARRTAARRKHQAARLKPSESELLLRLARALAAAADVLDGVDPARQWLISDNRALGSRKPIELLDTGIGFQEVMDVLRRIEQGVYS